MAFNNIFKRIRSRDAPDIQSAIRPHENQGLVRRLFPPRIIASGDFSLVNNETIFAAVTRISNTFATVRFHLYKDRVIQHEHPMERLITDNPNFVHTPFGFQQTMEAYRNTTGNTYAFKVPKVGGGISRLDIIDPTRVEPLLNKDTEELW